MRGVRGHLIAIALTLLVQQGAGLAAVAALECCRTPVKPAATAMQCCREGASTHICPLAKSRTTNVPKCKLTGDCTRTDDPSLGAALFLLSSPAPAVVTLIAPPAIEVHRITADALPLERALSPPTQPPKF